MADLSTTRTDLDNITQRLKRRWHEAEEVWDDAVQRDFEKRFIAPLFVQIQATRREMDELAARMAQARLTVR